MNLLPSTEPREPDVRRLSPAELRVRLMSVAAQIKETKGAIEVVKAWPESAIRLWTVDIYGNRINGLMQRATVLATALAQIPSKE